LRPQNISACLNVLLVKLQYAQQTVSCRNGFGFDLWASQIVVWIYRTYTGEVREDLTKLLISDQWLLSNIETYSSILAAMGTEGAVPHVSHGSL